MNFINLVTPPAVEPVTLAELGSAARYVVGSPDDSLLTGLIVSARQWCETYTDRVFISQTFDLVMDGFPFGGGYFNRNVRACPSLGNWLPTHSGSIELPRPPVQSIVSITYLDSAGLGHTLSPSIYRVLGGSESPTLLTTQANQIFPVTFPQIGAATVRFTAGYGDTAASVPQGIKDAIKLLVASWYNDLTMVQEVGEVPQGIKSILAPFVWGA